MKGDFKRAPDSGSTTCRIDTISPTQNKFQHGCDVISPCQPLKVDMALRRSEAPGCATTFGAFTFYALDIHPVLRVSRVYSPGSRTPVGKAVEIRGSGGGKPATNRRQVLATVRIGADFDADGSRLPGFSAHAGGSQKLPALHMLRSSILMFSAASSKFLAGPLLPRSPKTGYQGQATCLKRPRITLPVVVSSWT